MLKHPPIFLQHSFSTPKILNLSVALVLFTVNGLGTAVSVMVSLLTVAGIFVPTCAACFYMECKKRIVRRRELRARQRGRSSHPAPSPRQLTPATTAPTLVATSLTTVNSQPLDVGSNTTLDMIIRAQELPAPLEPNSTLPSPAAACSTAYAPSSNQQEVPVDHESNFPDELPPPYSSLPSLSQSSFSALEASPCPLQPPPPYSEQEETPQ